MDIQSWTYLIVFASFALYIGIAIWSRARTTKGFYVAVGFSGHGFKLSPTVGAMMAEFVTTGSCQEFDINLFRASRFADGELIGSEFDFNVLA